MEKKLKNNKDIRVSNTNNYNMRGINHIIIDENDKGFNIKWILNIVQTTHKRKAKDGTIKEYYSYSTSFPKGVLDYIGNVEKIYFYEYFEKICITNEEPTYYPHTLIKPHLTIGKKDRRYNIAKEYGDRSISLPKKYWEITEDMKVELTLHNKPDYANPKKFLITIDVVPS